MSSNHNSPVLYSPYSPPEPNSLSPWSQSAAQFGSENSGYDSLTLPPINPDADDNYGELPSFINDFALPRLQDPFLPEASTASRAQDDGEQAPPASNQQTRAAPRQRPLFPQYGFGEFESPDPFDGDFDDLANFVEALDRAASPPAEMPSQRTTTRRSSIVDLTSSPPDMRMATTRKRKAEEDAAAGQARASKKTARAAKSGEASTSSSRRQSLGDVEVVDLADVENESQYKDLAAKQQAELIKKQNEDEARRPVKLAAFQCIICMDNPTDLTVTHCGMYLSCGFERSYLTL